MTIRLTHTTVKVLEAFFSQPADGLSGADIAKQTRLMAGTLYPILNRLERVGWLKSKWEDIDPSVEGRPRRKFYTLSAQGARQARKQLEARGFDLPWLKPSLGDAYGVV